MIQIQKREGDLVAFDRTRIKNAIYKALKATDRDSELLADIVAQDVVEQLPKDGVVYVEQIQDVVERCLMLRGLTVTAKSYILYRDAQQRKRSHLQA